MSRQLQRLAEASTARIASAGSAWHAVLNVAPEASLQEVKPLGAEENGGNRGFGWGRKMEESGGKEVGGLEEEVKEIDYYL